MVDDGQRRAACRQYDRQRQRGARRVRAVIWNQNVREGARCRHWSMMPVKCEEFENATARYGGESVREAFNGRSYRRWVKAPFCEITVPLDRSETARRGIDYAIQLARGGAVLHFCSIVDIVGACSARAGPMMNPALLTESLEADAERVCRDAVGAARKNGITADSKVIYGAVVPSIGQYANETRKRCGGDRNACAPRAFAHRLREHHREPLAH